MGETTDAGAATESHLSFAELPGWDRDDHNAAFAAFRRGAAVLAEHPPKQRSPGANVERLKRVLAIAGAMPADTPSGVARKFFETHFRPRASAGRGFFTGYYEPEVDGSLTRAGAFTVPLLRPPDDLVELPPADAPAGIDRFARRTDGGFTEYVDRGAIMAGALDGRGLEIVWLTDPVDAFFIHVQGSARVRLPDGRTLRLSYAAKTGHPYTPIGRVLIERGALKPGAVTMEAIRAWLAAHTDEAATVLAANRSYIFFREVPVADPALGPVAAAKVPLTAGRSLAVDRLLHPFHLPVWVETHLPGGMPWRRLMIAQDTGSAIVGPARGDIFFGSGDAAGAIAGGMRADGLFVTLEPVTA